MDIDKLLNLSKEELNKLTKDTIVSTIAENAWRVNSRERTVEDLQKQLAANKAPYNQAKLMLVGLTGFKVELDEWTKQPNIDKVDLCQLIGVALAQNQSLLAKRG